MNTGRIIAIIVMLLGVCTTGLLLFNDIVPDAEQRIGILFFWMPCSLLLFLVGLVMFLLLPKQAKTKFTMVCPKCGYNMRGLTQARCPECGAEFTLDQLKLK